MSEAALIQKLKDGIGASPEEFASNFLGFGPADVFALLSSADNTKVNQFWGEILTKIETSPELNPQDGDSDELKKLKSLARNKAQSIYSLFNAETTGERARSDNAARLIEQSKTLVSRVETGVAAVFEKNSIAGVVRIGQVLLGPDNLDPTNISVSEVHLINRLSTLRSETDAAVKLPRSQTQITLDLVFTGEAQINQTFRYLLAHLMASPITTLESPFLTATLINHYSTPEIENLVRRAVAADDPTIFQEASRLRLDIVNSFENLKDILSSNDNVIEYFDQLLRDRNEPKSPAEPIMLSKKMDRIGVSVPVAFQDIVVSTDGGSPNTIHVRLTFLRFNSHAFGEFGLEFRDINGNRTSDIMQSEPLRRYTNWAFLTETRPQHYLRKYTAHLLEDSPDFKCSWADLHQLDKTHQLSNLNFVVASVQAAFNIKLAALPIVGSKFPIIQVLGRGGIEARVTIHTTDENVVRELTIMKDTLDAVSRNQFGMFRDEQIEIQNSVLNMLGATKFLIRSFEVSPIEDTSNGFTIDLSLIQAQYNYSIQESLLFLDSTIPDEVYRAFWEHLWNIYQGFRNSTDFPNSPTGKPLKTEQQQLLEYLLFGTLKLDLTEVGGNRSAVINDSLIVAASMYMFNPSTKYNTDDAALNAYRLLFMPTESQFTAPDPKGSVAVRPASTTFTSPTRLIKTPNLAADAAARRLFDISADPESIDALAYYRRAVNINQPFNETLIVPKSNNATYWLGDIINVRFHGGVDEYPESRFPFDFYRWRDPVTIYPTVGSVPGKDLRPDRTIGPIKNTAKYDWYSVKIYLQADPFRGTIGLRKSLWDAMIEVMLDLRRSPRAIWNAEKGEFDNGKKAYDDKAIQRAFAELTWVLMNDRAKNLGFDLSRFADSAADNRKIMNTKDRIDRETARRLTSNYPDIPLPTYADMFPYDVMLKDPTDPAIRVPQWTRFAPTYSDLGAVPITTFGQSMYREMHKINRDKTDVMEPGFWFFHHRLRNFTLSRAESALKLEGHGIKDVGRKQLRVPINTERLKNLPADQVANTLAQEIEQLHKDDLLAEKGFKEEKKKWRIFDIITPEGKLVGLYRPKNRNANNAEYIVEPVVLNKRYIVDRSSGGRQFERGDQDRNVQLLGRLLRHVPDNAMSLVKAYPAFRVYFVEWDNNNNREDVDRLGRKGRVIRRLDDLYTSNAIISINVTDAKDDSAVAEIQILNTVGTFDTDSFLSDDERKNLKIGVDDEDNEDYLMRMRLQTGTGIVIQAGYSSHINGLRTLFTGQIVEIQPGKVITIIAQSYKVELDQEVEVGIPNGNPRDAINKLLQLGNEKKNLTPHLGRIYDSRDFDEDQLARFLGNQSKNTGFFGLQGVNGTIARTFGYWVPDIGRNVYIESNVGPQGWWGQFWQDVKELGPVPELEYAFTGQTAWQGLQEMTRHLAGTVCAVRPFDNEATVFFGYPELEYEYRTPSAFELSQWNLHVKPARLEATLGIETNILSRFWQSDFGTTSRLKTERDLERALIVSPVNVYGGDTEYITALNPGKNLTSEDNKFRIETGKTVDNLSQSYTGLLAWLSKFTNTRDFWVDQEDSFFDTTDKRFLPMTRALLDTTALDFSEDWGMIAGKYPGLARFIFAYFFGIDKPGESFTPELEQHWEKLVLLAMRPWWTSNGWNGDRFGAVAQAASIGREIQTTASYKDLLSAMVGADVELDWIIRDEFEDGTFSQKVKDVLGKRQTVEEAVKYADPYLQRLVDSGQITVEEKAKRLAEIKKRYESLQETYELVAGLDSRFANGTPNPVTIDGDDELGKFLLSSFPYFRLFVHYFANWMRSDIAANDSALNKTETKEDLGILDDVRMEPWKRPFREVHAVNESMDIIDNSIVASASEMANTILVRGPTEATDLGGDDITDRELGEGFTEGGDRVFTNPGDWRSWPSAEGVPFHPKLKKSSRKLAVAIEPNANSNERLAQCLMSNASMAIRPMYRGELKIVGRAVFPWDVIILHDSYSSMFGRIEVERVTHEFNSETGWVTTIVPHAYCHVNNPWGAWQLAQSSYALAWLGLATDVLFAVSMLWPVAAAAWTLGRLAASTASRSLIKYAQKAGVTGITSAMKKDGLSKIAKHLATAGAPGLEKAAINSAVWAARKEAAITTAKYAGKVAARNWWSYAGRAGAMIGTYWLASRAVNATIDWTYNGYVQERMNNTCLPVDLVPLTYKGAPLTAGLDLGDEHFLTFGEKVEGFYKEVKKGIGEFFEGGQYLALEGGLLPDEKPIVPGG